MWWMDDQYEDEQPLPSVFTDMSGPEGPALVRLWADGTTDPGWGESGFITNYTKGRFRSTTILKGYSLGKWQFALVMRSMGIVCIDIDGKNGGLKHAGKLGMLPYTLAETSKSGNGYHLFYSTEEDEWDGERGFAMFRDRINLEQGVDFRGTGCVYHHRQQRWNSREMAALPKHLVDRLRTYEQKTVAQATAIMKIQEEGDPMDIALMHHSLVEDLAKPIPSGRRNTTLFAIGQQMLQAGVPDWEKLVMTRALAVGLDTAEAAKLLRNINRYGASA